MEAPLAVEALIQHRRSMRQLLSLLAFGLLVPSAALARVDADVAAECRDTRDFYGCVRAFTTPAERSDAIAPHAGVMGQYFPRGMNPTGRVEVILQGVLR